jgi:3-oxoadipate enol-lactonase
MPFVQLKDARIHYELAGPENAPVLALSNSLGTNYSMWDAQALEFTKSLRVLRYDTRGHGQSSVTPGPYSIEQLARDVIELLDILHLDKAHFCGLSMGGMIGMWLGANAPNRLRKMVLCNTAAKIGSAEIWNTRIETVRKSGMQAVACSIIERWFTAAFRAKAPALVAEAQHMLESANAEGYAACCAAIRDMDQREKLSAIRVPTLVIAGAHDPVTPPAEGHYLAEHIPGARYAEMNAAHLSNIEDRDRFTAEVQAFLNS